MNEKVYCIIVTYNAMKWADRCLGSLRDSLIPCIPVIVDNLSKDETVPYIKRNYPEAHIIENKENRGFGQANNQGIELAYREGATHFFLLNQDAWVHPDTIGKLISVQNKLGISIVSPIHLNGAGDDLDKLFKVYVTSNKEITRTYVADNLLGQEKGYYEADRINAAAWMLNKEDIEKIGGFDPVFFLYGEDDNYVQRVKFHGGKVFFVPKAYINHDRKIHGDAKAYKKLELRNCLVRSYTNINIKLFKITQGRLYWHARSVYLFFMFLFTLRFKDAISVIGSNIEFMKSWPQIIKSRKQNKAEAPNWLNL